MSNRRRRRSHRKIARFFRGFFYILLLSAIVAALVLVVRDNRKQKAERTAYKEALTKMEESEDFETTLSTVRTSVEEEETEDLASEVSEPTDSSEEEPTEDLTTTALPEKESSEASEEDTSEDVVEEAEEVKEEEETTDTTLSAEASAMKMVVLNGTMITGVAGKWKTKLSEAGYQNITTSNYGGKVEKTTVIYGAAELTESLRSLFPNAVFVEEGTPADMQTSSVGQNAYDCYIVIGADDTNL